MEEINIILADSQYLTRVGLQHLFKTIDSFKILGEAKNAQELKQLVNDNPADVVILDYNQPGAFGKETINMVKDNSPDTNLLIISADEDKSRIYEILEMGINSFLTKQCDQEEIINAVNATAKGEKFFCNNVLNYLLEKSFAKDIDEDCSAIPLSLREREIVRLVAKGKIAKQIASDLGLSTHTIYTHRKNIMRKLQLNSTSELVMYALNHGIVENS